MHIGHRCGILVILVVTFVSPSVDEVEGVLQTAGTKASRVQPSGTRQEGRGLAASIQPALLVRRLRGGVSTRSTRSGSDKGVASAADATRSRARGRRRGRARGRGRGRERGIQGKLQPADAVECDSDTQGQTTRSSLHDDTKECGSAAEILMDREAASLVAAVDITPPVDCIAADEPTDAGPRATNDFSLAGAGLSQEMACLQAEVRAALASLNIISAEDTGSNDVPGDYGGDGARAGGDSDDNGTLEVVISPQDPVVVEAIEKATRVRSFANEERRARVVVREGTFTWRGIIPAIAFQEGSDGPVGGHRLETCRPVETQLHVSGPPAQLVDTSLALGSKDREPVRRCVGSDGRAQLHGDWLLGHKSRGSFSRLMLRSSAWSNSTMEALATPPASDAATTPVAAADQDSSSGGADSAWDSEHLARGFWRRWAAGDGEGVEDKGALPTCMRVEGGPWAVESCHVLSERGIPVSVDDPESEYTPVRSEPSEESGVEDEGPMDPSASAGVSRDAARDASRPTLVIEKSRVGGTRLYPEAATAGGGGTNADEEEEHGSEKGSCVSAVHVSGHGIVSANECLVGACLHAGVVASEQGQVSLCRSEVEVCGFVALALSAAAEVYARDCSFRALACAAVSLVRGNPLDLSRDAFAEGGDVVRGSFRVYSETDEDEESGQEQGEDHGSGETGSRANSRECADTVEEDEGLRCKIRLEGCSLASTPALWAPGEEPDTRHLSSGQVQVLRCSGAAVGVGSGATFEQEACGEDMLNEGRGKAGRKGGEQLERVQGTVSGEDVETVTGGMEGDEEEDGEEADELNPFWRQEQKDLIENAEHVLGLLRALNAQRGPCLERVRALGREGFLLNPVEQPPPEAMDEYQQLVSRFCAPEPSTTQRLMAELAKANVSAAGGAEEVRQAGLDEGEGWEGRLHAGEQGESEEGGEAGEGGDEDEETGVEEEGDVMERGRTKADLREEKAQLMREMVDKMAAGDEALETDCEEVERWEREYINLKGAARRHVGSMAMNLTDRHWNVMSPPSLSAGDCKYLEELLQPLIGPSSSREPSVCALPRRLQRQLIHELRAYCDASGRSPSLRHHLAALDAGSLRDDKALQQVGDLIAEEHRQRFPPPSKEELVRILASGRPLEASMESRTAGA